MTEPNRRLSRRQALGVFGGAAATGFLVACGAATPSPSATPGAAATASGDPLAGLGLPSYYPASYKDVIEAAKKEPKLNVYSIMSKANWTPVMEEFKKKYTFIDLDASDDDAYAVFDKYYT
ncbi:MAG: hypothetical protein M3P38_05640, partial [Chloroflexota bacterium]|nr:hypothetical protein [Chloroflexota bacterium]